MSSAPSLQPCSKPKKSSVKLTSPKWHRLSLNLHARSQRKVSWILSHQLNSMSLMVAPSFIACHGRDSGTIARSYADITINHYGKATVVFEGYSEGHSIKDNTHQRRGQHTHPVSPLAWMQILSLWEGRMTSYPDLLTNMSLIILSLRNCRRRAELSSIHQGMQMWILSRLQSKPHNISPQP